EDDRKAALRAQELESVDFYIAQGYTDIAIDTLDLLERQFGKHPDIESRRQQVSHGTGSPEFVLEAGAPAEPFAVSPAAELSFSPETIEDATDSLSVEQPPTNAPAIDAGLAEIFEEYRVSAEADTNGDYETHYNLGLAYQEM